MQKAAEELELSMQVWRNVIVHLEHKIARRLQGEDREVDINADDDERVYTLGEMRREVTIFRLCIDWARDQQDLLAGRFNEQHAVQRQRFYKLMAVLAKAELDRDDHLRSVAFVSSRAAEHPTNQQSVDELEVTAAGALKALVGIV